MPDVLIKGYKMGQHQKFTKAYAAIPHKQRLSEWKAFV